MRYLTLLIFALFICAESYSADIYGMRCENQLHPLGVDTGKPSFSWRSDSPERGFRQSAFRIIVSDSRDAIGKDEGNMWDSGKCYSAQSLNVVYNGTELRSGQAYYWKVKVWDNGNNESSWSEASGFLTGLMAEEDWSPAKWIAMEVIDPADRIMPGHPAPERELPKEPAMPQFRRSFSLDKKVSGATVFISGLGHFELSVNGDKVGDNFLDPGWSNYEKSAYYVTFDITDQLAEGENVLGVQLGNGFLHTPRNRDRYLKLLTSYAFPKMICKLRITYTDGTVEDIVSDTRWRVTESPVTFSSIYGGEDYDATREEAGWNEAGFDDRGWKTPVETVFAGELVSQTAPPLKVRQIFEPVTITETHPGIYIYDFGQNASAIVSLRVKGEKGAKVIMRPAEYLTDDGLANQNSSGKDYYFSYTLSGGDTECWNPSFTYYGFRYVQVEGAVPEGFSNPSDLPTIEGLEMWHIRNGSETVGSFNCSNELFNDIYNLIDWSVKSNMASVLTDCPHREKLGWLEVAHLMSKSIAYTYDVRLMMNKIVKDMRNAQQPNGLITSTAPEYTQFSDDFRDSPEWGSAGVLVPWFLYTWYGDMSALTENYDVIKKYVDYLTSRSTDHIVYHGLGDWYDLGPAHPGYSQLTTRGLTPTAIYYQDLCITARIAELLGEEKDAVYYGELAENVKKAFNEKFLDPDAGYYDTGSQTANAMPLFLGLTPPEHRETVLRRVIDDIRSRDNSITSGDVGFNYLLRVLEREGASDVIFDMNNQSDKPGYGYQLKQGATSLTESWNALKTASHNHCMLGHLMEWFYSGLGGIKPLEEEGSMAFKRFTINPQTVGDITHAEVDFDSPYGMIGSHWEKTDSGFRYRIRIPANTSAYVYFPTENAAGITENGIPAEEIENMVFVRTENGSSVFEVFSGLYDFHVTAD